MPEKSLKTVFLDLDGVVADFDGHFRRTTGFEWGHAPESTPEQYPHLYRNPPLLPDAQRLVGYLKGRTEYLTVLTALPRSLSFPYAGTDKLRWVREHFGDIEFRLAPYAHNKFQHCLSPDDILIDDSPENIAAWPGIGILHTSVDDTIRILEEL